jgi:hypothetical protein
MAVRGKPVKVLRLLYRMSLMPEVQNLSHTAFRWLFGLVMTWSGTNNGALTFTQHRHGKELGLSHPETFQRARDEVLATKLISVIDPGGRNKAAQYAIAVIEIQARAIATPNVAMPKKILATPDVAIDAEIATPDVANWYGRRSNEKSLHIMNARGRARASSDKLNINNKTARRDQHCVEPSAHEEADRGDGELASTYSNLTAATHPTAGTDEV